MAKESRNLPQSFRLRRCNELPSQRTRLSNRDVLEIAFFLLLAFGGDISVFILSKDHPPSRFFEILPAVGIGLYLAFRVARRAYQRAAFRDEGIRCAKCGYDLRATPLRCPECGNESSAERVEGFSRKQQIGDVISSAFGMLVIAVVAAGAIMVHVQVQGSGH